MANLTSNDSSSVEDIDEISMDYDISKNTAVNLTYYIVSLILGLPGNIIILQTYGRKKRKKSTDVLIMGQAVIDLLACLLSSSFIVRSGFPYLTTIGLCRFVFYAEEMFALNAVLLTSLISINRYLAVCRPLQRRMTVRKSISLLMLCAIFSISTCLPCPIEISLVIWKGKRVCKIVSRNSLGIVLFLTFISAMFTVSFVVNSILYILIYIFLRKRAKIHADLTGGNKLAKASSNSSIAGSLGSNSRVNDAETRGGILLRSEDTRMKELSGPLHDTSQVEKTSESHNYTTEASGSNLAESTTEPSKQHTNKPTDDASTLVATDQQGRNVSPNRPKAQNNKKDFGRKTTRMLLIVTIFLFATWIPQIGFLFIPSSVIHGKAYLKIFLSIFFNLRLLNHIINFYVYYFVNSSFRSEVMESFAKYPCCK